MAQASRKLRTSSTVEAHEGTSSMKIVLFGATGMVGQGVLLGA
jgi:hypothetical protein